MVKAYIVCAILIFLTSAPIFAEEIVDTDSDGISNNDEILMYRTDPNLPDTDADGYSDGDEIAHGYSPHFGDRKKLIQVDSDKDYLNDAWEILLGTDIMNPDSDGDKYLDGTEVAAGYDPLDPGRVQIEKQIDIDLAKQRLTYRFGETIVGSFPISSGVSSMPTPRGEFEILAKVPMKHYGGVGFDYPNTKWNLHFTTKKYRYYIHGAYWHDNFGKPMSHGCVNVSYENMEPLYWFSQIGTTVLIH